jgi:DNA-binding CsgD family transcriptional regulator
MIFNIKDRIKNVENKLFLHLDFIIGKEEEFSFDHRLFNWICLIVTISYFFRILINFILGIKFIEIILPPVITLFFIISIYFLSRHFQKVGVSKFLFLSVLLIAFSFSWFYTGGSKGVIPFYYFSLLMIIIFVFRRTYKILAVCIILINVALLIFNEYYHPFLIVQKLEVQKFFLYKSIHLLFLVVITLFIIEIARVFHREERSLQGNVADKLQFQNENGSNKFQDIFQNLSLQERKIMELMLDGKRNKEIAAVLNVDISTVKTHINNIYRKLGVKNRLDILNGYRA